MLTRAVIVLLALLLPAPALADLAGRASVIDGDTIEIHGERIRLFGIDAPESRQLCQADAEDGRFYAATKIDTARGERWFCTEAEALAAGWRRSKQ